MTVRRQGALLLLGPTGSGKTPLGQMLERHGLHGAPCLHFDFGENLRQLVAGGCPNDAVSRQDIELLRGVLASGALLEDEQLPLAERILRSFLSRRPTGEATLVVLNGLPRHVGQAQAIDAVLDVRAVVCLECSADTAALRLASNVGGDRGDRSDDLDRLPQKLAQYRQRTAPLVGHYRGRGAFIYTIPVTPATTPQDAWVVLERF